MSNYSWIETLNYHWIEAFHIIAVIMWMAGMLYLPRLYVYHSEVTIDSDSNTLLKIMERRLLKYIINPAMIVTIILGLLLAEKSHVYHELWFHIKISAILVMLVIHMLLARHFKDFKYDNNRKSSLYFRILNEIVTVLIIVIVIAVVVKPFL